MYDVTVIGAGLAGLQLARLVARGGASVLLVDARRAVTEGVRTTGIFVRRTFEDFQLLDPFLGPPLRRVSIHSPAGRTIAVESGGDEFRVGRMKRLYESLLQQAIAAGAEWMPATAYAGMRFGADRVEIVFRDGRSVKTRFVAGADGARSGVARDLRLDRNHRWITGVENVYESSGHGARIDCWIDPRIAPGYIAWLLDDGEEIHAGVGGYRQRFDPASALRAFEERLRGEGRLEAAKPLERRGGLIPVNGVLRRIRHRRGLLVGDAAGAVSPLTAGGLDACMRLSAHAAEVLLATLRSGRDTVGGYDGAAFRTRFASRLAMRCAFDLGTRFQLGIECGFALARTASTIPLVRHIFFGRCSFPDAAPAAGPLSSRA